MDPELPSTCQTDVDLVGCVLRSSRGLGHKRVSGWDLILQQHKQCSVIATPEGALSGLHVLCRATQD